MAGICFYFEDNDVDVWSGRQIDLDAWNYAIKLTSDIDKVKIVNKSDSNINHFDNSLEVEILNSMPQLSGSIAQLVCPWENTPSPKTSIWNFNHNVDWYIFGPGSGWGGYYTGTPITIPQNGLGACHSIHICTLVMAHRYKTLWV